MRLPRMVRSPFRVALARVWFRNRFSAYWLIATKLMDFPAAIAGIAKGGKQPAHCVDRDGRIGRGAVFRSHVICARFFAELPPWLLVPLLAAMLVLIVLSPGETMPHLSSSEFSPVAAIAPLRSIWCLALMAAATVLVHRPRSYWRTRGTSQRCWTPRCCGSNDRVLAAADPLVARRFAHWFWRRPPDPAPRWKYEPVMLAQRQIPASHITRRAETGGFAAWSCAT